MLIPPSLSFLFCITQADRSMAHLALVPEGRRGDDGELMIPNEARILGGRGEGSSLSSSPTLFIKFLNGPSRQKRGGGREKSFHPPSSSSSLSLLLYS